MTKAAKTNLAHRLYTGELSYQFIGKRRRWYLVSAILLAISILTLLIRGLSLGIEFKGGAEFKASMPVASQTVGEVRDAITDLDLPDLGSVTVQTLGSDGVRVQTRSLSTDEVTQVRATIAEIANVDSDEVAYSLIGASWGKQITDKGAIALVVFLVLVMLMIWVYFRDWKMSVSAIVALGHDLIITVGVYALVGFTVTPATLIGVLTILGYSLYDTVVVFDKVRENVREIDRTNKTYSQAANLAVNQVLVRSLNTTLIGVLPVAALLIAGSIVLHSGPLTDLGMALFVGMIAGAYSSIFIATPLVASLKEREPEEVERRARLERRAQRQQARKSTADDAAPEVVMSTAATPFTTVERRERRVKQTRKQRKNKRR